MSGSKLKYASRITVFVLVILALLFTQVGSVYAVENDPTVQLQVNSYAIVFVSRKIQPNGSVYMSSSATGSMPGVGPYSRFQVSAPGRLLVREANGTLRTLIDGANPTAASLNLIDVNAPDVSYNGTKIVFAGLVAGSYSTEPLTDPGGWRIYTINVDGTGLQQVTVSDRDNLDLSQFKDVASNFKKYDDTDPAWLPDGRIVFSSTRWPSFGQYGGVHTSNLYVVNANGTSLHRITSERNGADRPQVDPLTGKIVYSRWWRNFRVAIDDMGTKPDPLGGFIMKDGLLSVIYSQPPPSTNEVGGFRNLDRNTWHLATINPDGTGLAQWGGRSSSFFYGQIANHAYGGGFAPDGSFYANFFPMNNMTEASGFGGIRRYQRGPNGYVSIIGVTVRNDSTQTLVSYNPPSHGIYQSSYAGETEVLPDGRLLISLAKDVKQDYGLYIVNNDGSNLTPLYDNPGTTELRARVIRTRPIPPIISDKITQVASLLPPPATGPYDKAGTFTFQALNVYFNAPVDTDIISAMPVGSASTIRFFIDHQRWEQTGSHEGLDWPILLKEIPVDPDGSVTHQSPANVPLFEQIRSAAPGYKVPLTGKAAHPEEMGGAAHVAGMNFGRPGETQRCVGCHAGHSMIPVPANSEDAKWTNLAPGATVSVSSLDAFLPNTNGLIDRRVKMSFPEKYQKYWISKAGSDPTTQWVQLTFPIPITVRTVRLYNIPSSDSAIQVQAATVKLFSDAAGTNLVGSNTSGALTSNGTNVSFTDLPAQVVRVEFNSVSGGVAALAEMEVIARAGGDPGTSPTVTVMPTGTASTATYTPTPTAINATSSTPTYTFTPTAINAKTATATYTPTPTAVNAKTRTPTSVNSPQPTFTAMVLPTMTAINLATATPLPTFTALAAKTSTALPTINPNALIFPPALLTTERGTTKGSLPSLGMLKLSGSEDNPNEYVAFQPQNSKYSGYLSYTIPANVQPSSNSEVSLQVNFKAASSAKQRWIWSIYDWTTKTWVQIGEVTVKGQTQWKMLSFNIKQLQQYASAGNEVRIQLRTNNTNNGAMLDYQVIQLTNLNLSVQSQNIVPVIPTGTPSVAPTTIVLSPTVIPSDTPTAVPETPTP